MRTIRDPLIAASPCERPASIPIGRPRGAKALGVRYERALAKQMPWARHGSWWAYRDMQGAAYCQTDFWWMMEDGLVVVGEAKYSWVPDGIEKLARLYEPIVGMALQRPTIGLLICKNVKPGVRHVFGTLREAIIFARASACVIPTVQWLGTAAIASPFDSDLPMLKRRFAGAAVSA